MELERIEEKIIKKLVKMKIKYEKIDLDDKDINFYLEIDAKRFIEEFKSVGKIGTLMYINTDAETLTIFCGNIYRECNKESLLKIINIINSVNRLITYGKIFADKEGKIVYQHTVSMNNSTDIEKYIKAFILAVWIFYCEMKKFEGNYEKK